MDLSKSVVKFDMTPPEMKDWWSKIPDGGDFKITISGKKIGTTANIGEGSVEVLEPEGMQTDESPTENPEEAGTVEPSDSEPVAVLISSGGKKKATPGTPPVPVA